MTDAPYGMIDDEAREAVGGGAKTVNITFG